MRRASNSEERLINFATRLRASVRKSLARLSHLAISWHLEQNRLYLQSYSQTFSLRDAINALESSLNDLSFMPGKQAKILSDRQIEDLLFFAKTTRDPTRNSVIVLLSVKAGLRAAEIADLTWEMIVEPNSDVASHVELRDHAAKKGSGRTVPLGPALHAALVELRVCATGAGPVVRSERGGKMTASSIVVWFNRAYKAVGFEGCSSHSGRRTFITRAARLVHKAGGSLRDVQLLAGHRSIQTTQAYIDGDSDAQRRLVSLI